MAEYQKIYNLLRGAGLSEAGALGLIGNWDCESNCEPNRVQGDFSSFRSVSKAYVNSLNNGSLTRDRFMNDQKGFGLAQWTYFSRKAELYDTWKATGLPIDSVELQVSFALKELKRDNAGLLKMLCSTYDIYDACSRVCKEFEKPAVNNIDARFQSATRIKYQIDLSGREEGGSDPVPVNPDPKPAPGPVPTTEYWPPRMIDRNMNGYDVMVLQSVLKARGYAVTEVDGNFGDNLDQAVRKFQSDYSLEVDGVVGPKSWAKLLEMK